MVSMIGRQGYIRKHASVYVRGYMDREGREKGCGGGERGRDTEKERERDSYIERERQRGVDRETGIE